MKFGDLSKERVSDIFRIPENFDKDFRHGRKIGSYLIGRILGTGSFAKVKEGLHILTGEKVAVKMLIKRNAFYDRYTRQHMRREGQILQAVQHPYVIHLYELMETSKGIYMVTELCHDDLLTYIQQNIRLAEDEVRRLTYQIVSALAHIHRLGIVHRDLKIENLLLDKNLNIKIIDFGLSNSIKMTKNGLVNMSNFCATQCGSPAYAAPEVLGQEKYGSKVDVWSVGINMYVMLTGRLPFTVEPFSIKRLRDKMLAKDIRPIACRLTHDGLDLIEKLLSPDPRTRPSIQEVLVHKWILDDPQSLEYRPQFTGRHNRYQLNTHILSHMVHEQHFRLTDVVERVSANIPCEHTAVYHLWLNRYLRFRTDTSDDSTEESSLTRDHLGFKDSKEREINEKYRKVKQITQDESERLIGKQVTLSVLKTKRLNLSLPNSSTQRSKVNPDPMPRRALKKKSRFVYLPILAEKQF